ncbi:MAG: DUF423 domain-containing protein [Flavobacteriales bacterium]
MNKRTLAWASGILLMSVGLGAYGAHALELKGVAADHRAIWETAVKYQFYHGLALLWLSTADARLPARLVSLVRVFFVGGILLFCGSLYLLATRDVLGIEGLTPVLGPITPLGGALFLAGWVVLLVAALRKG